MSNSTNSKTCLLQESNDYIEQQKEQLKKIRQKKLTEVSESDYNPDKKHN